MSRESLKVVASKLLNFRCFEAKGMQTHDGRVRSSTKEHFILYRRNIIVQKCFKRMELKSVHWRFSANRISLFALNSQSHWLIFGNFGNLCRFSEVWLRLKKRFEKLCTTKSPQNFLNPMIFFDCWNISNLNRTRKFWNYN